MLKVEGLCIGGSGVNLSNKGVGYIFLMRKKKGTEKKQVKARSGLYSMVLGYQKTVFLLEA